MMEPFAILGMSMIVLGLVMLLGGIGLLMYGIWLRYWVEPSRNGPMAPIAPESNREVQQP